MKDSYVQKTQLQSEDPYVDFASVNPSTTTQNKN